MKKGLFAVLGLASMLFLPLAGNAQRARPASACMNDLMRGDFRGKKFTISDVGMLRDQAGKAMVAILERKRARLVETMEGTDFFARIHIDSGFGLFMPDDLSAPSSFEHYRIAKLEVELTCNSGKQRHVPLDAARKAAVHSALVLRLEARAWFLAVEGSYSPYVPWEAVVKELFPVIEKMLPVQPTQTGSKQEEKVPTLAVSGGRCVWTENGIRYVRGYA